MPSRSRSTGPHHYKYTIHSRLAMSDYENKRTTSQPSYLNGSDVIRDESLKVPVSNRASGGCLGEATNMQLLGDSTDDLTNLVSISESNESGHLVRVSETQPRIWRERYLQLGYRPLRRFREQLQYRPCRTRRMGLCRIGF